MDVQEITEALNTALQMELDGKQFYQEYAEKATVPLVRRLFLRLSQEEDSHYHKVEEIYKTLIGSQDWPDTDPAFWYDKSIKSVFREALEDTHKGDIVVPAVELEGLDVAIKLEDKSYNFYHDRSSNAVRPKEKAFFDALAAEERGHYLALIESKDFLLDPEGWFSKKERWSLDGG